MRISTKKDDAGYFKRACGAKVFLDGKEIHSCFTADEETGEAFCYIKENGRYVLEEGGESIKTIVLKGKVQIILSEERDK